MNIYLTLLIPLFFTAIFYYVKPRAITYWELLVPTSVTFIVIIIIKLLFETSAVRFDEWIGSSVVEIYEQEPYNYWDHQTCSRSYPCGSDSKETQNIVQVIMIVHIKMILAHNGI